MSAPRLKPSARKVLDLLRAARPGCVTTGQFAEERCPRASARIAELRHEFGCDIDAKRVRNNAFAFTLIHEPSGLPGAHAGLGVGGAVPPAELPPSAVDPEAEAPPPPEPTAPAPGGRLFDVVDIDIPRPRLADPDQEWAA